MTAPRRTRGTADDLDEREVDLGRWRRALVALWWIPVAGLVLGAIVGVLFSFRGGTVYKATALISLGQPTSPGGALVNGLRHEPAGGLADRQLGSGPGAGGEPRRHAAGGAPRSRLGRRRSGRRPAPARRGRRR